MEGPQNLPLGAPWIGSVSRFMKRQASDICRSHSGFHTGGFAEGTGEVRGKQDQRERRRGQTSEMREADEAEQDMNAHLKLQERKSPGRDTKKREEIKGASPVAPPVFL